MGAADVKRVDLNCDLGEWEGGGDGGELARDAALLAVVTSANIACGGHVGDALSMEAVARVCVERGVRVGAHPGYPDRAGFGRKELGLSAEEIERHVAAQVGSLAVVGGRVGASVGHVKPHGAMYHAASTREGVAEAIARGVIREVGKGVVMVGLAGSRALEVWRGMGMRVAAEGFADRRYERDGTLRGRGLAGAVIEDAERAGEQAVRMVKERKVATWDGAEVAVQAQTICVHSDSPGALELVREVRKRLEAEGVEVGARW